jgi:hypothetical protein
MPKLALVYGVRLVPAEDLDAVENAKLKLKDGREAGVTMHLLEGDNEEQLKEQLLRSLDAFFDFYPEV